MNETIIKIANKTENFTIVSNEVPKTNTLSARAKGIYFYLMTLPKDWEIHKTEIYTHFLEGREALDTAWSELVSTGYIEKEIVRENGKIAGNRWKVYESCRLTGKPSTGKPVTRKPVDGKPVTGNPLLLSTNELSTDNTNDLKQTKNTNVFSPVFESYISMYESIYGFKPTIIYSRITEQLKKLTKDITIDQVILAIEQSREDDFSKKIKHELGSILSSGVIGRLINESIPKPLTSKVSIAPEVKNTCPKCGSILNQFRTCPQCNIEYDITGVPL